jgi:hypothetical protein
LPIRDSNGDVSLIYYQSNMIDVEGNREPSEDEILKIDVMNEVYFRGGYAILQSDRIPGRDRLESHEFRRGMRRGTFIAVKDPIPSYLSFPPVLLAPPP